MEALCVRARRAFVNAFALMAMGVAVAGAGVVMGGDGFVAILIGMVLVLTGNVTLFVAYAFREACHARRAAEGGEPAPEDRWG